MKTSTSRIASVALLFAGVLVGDEKFAPVGKSGPNPAARVQAMGLAVKGFARNDLKAIRAHVLMSLGDRDGVRVEHAVELVRLMGNSQLARGGQLVLRRHTEKLLP
jgi:hypothetical protein